MIDGAIFPPTGVVVCTSPPCSSRASLPAASTGVNEPTNDVSTRKYTHRCWCILRRYLDYPGFGSSDVGAGSVVEGWFVDPARGAVRTSSPAVSPWSSLALPTACLLHALGLCRSPGESIACATMRVMPRGCSATRNARRSLRRIRSLLLKPPSRWALRWPRATQRCTVRMCTPSIEATRAASTMWPGLTRLRGMGESMPRSYLFAHPSEGHAAENGPYRLKHENHSGYA